MELLPELQPLVAEHLEPKDAFACMQVSRAWHGSFSERTFRRVWIRSGYSLKYRVPPTGWMQRYGVFIQELNVRSASPLQSLLVTAVPQEQHRKDRSLQTVVLLPNLKTLDFSTCCTLNEVGAWLIHCPRLESLILNNVKSPPAFYDNTGEMILAKNRPTQLLRHCPRLIRLEIDNMGYNGSLQVPDLAEIISCWPPLLTEFRLMDVGVPRPWFAALSGFLDRLTILDLYECRRAEDWMLKRILCSAPLLVELGWYSFDVNGLFIEEDAGAAATASVAPTAVATMLSAAEENGMGMGPWACISLRIFTLFTISWSDSPFRNKAAMEHLGLLRDLRRLTINVMTGDIDSADGPWPEPRAYSTEDLQRVLEVRWMRETWPCLEYFELQRWSWI